MSPGDGLVPLVADTAMAVWGLRMGDDDDVQRFFFSTDHCVNNVYGPLAEFIRSYLKKISLQICCFFIGKYI